MSHSFYTEVLKKGAFSKIINRTVRCLTIYTTVQGGQFSTSLMHSSLNISDIKKLTSHSGIRFQSKSALYLDLFISYSQKIMQWSVRSLIFKGSWNLSTLCNYIFQTFIRCTCKLVASRDPIFCIAPCRLESWMSCRRNLHVWRFPMLRCTVCIEEYIV